MWGVGGGVSWAARGLVPQPGEAKTKERETEEILQALSESGGIPVLVFCGWPGLTGRNRKKSSNKKSIWGPKDSR